MKKWLEQELPKNLTIDDLETVLDKYGYSSVFDWVNSLLK